MSTFLCRGGSASPEHPVCSRGCLTLPFPEQRPGSLAAKRMANAERSHQRLPRPGSSSRSSPVLAPAAAQPCRRDLGPILTLPPQTTQAKRHLSESPNIAVLCCQTPEERCLPPSQHALWQPELLFPRLLNHFLHRRHHAPPTPHVTSQLLPGSFPASPLNRGHKPVSLVFWQRGAYKALAVVLT